MLICDFFTILHDVYTVGDASYQGKLHGSLCAKVSPKGSVKSTAVSKEGA